MDKQEPRNPERKSDASRKGGERRGPIGGSLLWYMIAVGVGMMLLTMWFNMEGGTKLAYLQFVELLKKMAAEKDPAKRAEVKIKVSQPTSSSEREFYYWGPSDVVVDEDEITGKIQRQPVDPLPSEKVRTEKFVVSRRGLAQGGGSEELSPFKLLYDAGLIESAAASPPSPWKMWLPTLVMTAL